MIDESEIYYGLVCEVLIAVYEDISVQHLSLITVKASLPERDCTLTEQMLQPIIGVVLEFFQNNGFDYRIRDPRVNKQSQLQSLVSAGVSNLP